MFILSSLQVVKQPGAARAAFPCQHCKKEFTAQSYVDRHVKKGACNRRRVGKQKQTTMVRGESNGGGAASTPSPSPDEHSPVPTPPTPSPQQQQPLRSNMHQQQPVKCSSKRGDSANDELANSRSGQQQQQPGGPYLQQNYNNPPHHHQNPAAPVLQSSTRDDPESYVLLEL